MKTYCKPAAVDIGDAGFNLVATKKAFAGKLKRNDFQKELVRTGTIKRSEIAQERLNRQGVHPKIDAAIVAYNESLTDCIRNRDLALPPIRQFEREDGLTHKMRIICQESPKQQVMEYIAVNALSGLFRAKLLPIQYGSIPNKGQVSGKRKIERLLRRKLTGDSAVIKGDVKKAYPSVTIGCVMKLLQRDIGKNKLLLWFVASLMENYPDGHLCIGSYLSTWLFNYVMSYVLRFMLDQYQTRRGVRTKLVHAAVCFADDFSLFGHYAQLKKVLKKTSKWCTATLGINIKPAWTIYRIGTFKDEKDMRELRKAGSKKRTNGVDMLGFVIRRTYTIIRGRVFRRIRRQVLRAWKDLEKLKYLPWWRACRLTAYKGWIKHSDSRNFADRLHLKKLFKIASRSVSLYGRKEFVRNEQRILLVAASGC